MCMLGKGQKVEVKQLMQLSGWSPTGTFLDECPERYLYVLFSIVFSPSGSEETTEAHLFSTGNQTESQSFHQGFICKTCAFFCWSERRSITWTSTCKWNKIEMKIQVNRRNNVIYNHGLWVCWLEWGWVDRWDMQLKELGYKMIGLPWWLRW